MFTGIIEEVGRIVDIDDSTDFRTIRVSARRVMDEIGLGASVAVNGVCLTVRSITHDSFTAELSAETLDRTTLRTLLPGHPVNLERPMRADSRFGGHIVQGHVDGTGRVQHFTRQGDSWDLEIEMPEKGALYMVEKGSIAVDGISLTVAALRSPGVFCVAIIPHTFDNTNLHAVKAGDLVNMEYDVIAKYVENLVRPYVIRNN